MKLAIAAIMAAAGRASSAPMGVAVQAVSNPLGKVVTLLREMKAQVEGEATTDDASYEKYSCWCKTSDAEKTTAVKDATARIDELDNFLAEADSLSAKLKTEIEGLVFDIDESKTALAEATAGREKERSNFEAEEADMKETIGLLKQAVDVLSKVQLVQKQSDADANREQLKVAAEMLLQVKRVVKEKNPKYVEVMQKDLYDILGSLEDSGASFSSNPLLTRRSVAALEQADPTNLQGAAANAKSYNSRSGSIFGILAEMKDEFERDLGNAQKEELQALILYNNLKTSKVAEIAAATKQKKAKHATLAELENKVAKSRKEKAALGKSRAADEAFLQNLRETCADEASQYESRVTVRSEEIRALGEAITILTEDDARDLFGKTMSFLQISNEATSSVASRELAQKRAAQLAMNRVMMTARKHNDWSLASVAVRVQLDSFTKVRQMMDKMVLELKNQQKNEDEKLSTCNKDIDVTEDEIKVNENQAEDLNEKHTAITNSLSALSTDIAKLSDDVSSMEISLKAAGENRKQENEVFVTSVSDQRATIEILEKALARLKLFYGGATLSQVRAHAEGARAERVDPPPPTPSDYRKSAASGGVIQLLMKIIADAEMVESVLEKSEQKSQKDYATLAADTTASIQANRAAIAEMQGAVAEAEGGKSETEGSQLANEEARGKLHELLAAHHVDCDWLVKYFDVRRDARSEEMQAIEEAKAILAGANYGTD
jgi:hypothetical protein